MATFSECAIEEAVSEAVKMMGYSYLTTKQEEIVKAFVRGQDAFVSLPTGSRKSIYYRILLIVSDLLRWVTGQSIAVIVSPLMALMKDQAQPDEKSSASHAFP